MKTRACPRRICNNCNFVRRRGKVYVRCSNPRHKQVQGMATLIAEPTSTSNIPTPIAIPTRSNIAPAIINQNVGPLISQRHYSTTTPTPTSSTYTSAMSLFSTPVFVAKTNA